VRHLVREMVELLSSPDVNFKGKNAPNSISTGGACNAPLQRSPDLLAGSKGSLLEGRGKEGGFSPFAEILNTPLERVMLISERRRHGQPAWSEVLSE